MTNKPKTFEKKVKWVKGSLIERLLSYNELFVFIIIIFFVWFPLGNTFLDIAIKILISIFLISQLLTNIIGTSKLEFGKRKVRYVEVK